MTLRRCIGCWQIKQRDDLIKITANHIDKNVLVNPNSLTFGRSAYLCYNESCIKAAFKKDKLARHIKASISEKLKGQILNEFRINKNK